MLTKSLNMIIPVLLYCLGYAVCHEITSLGVPLLADPRRAAELSCHFSMHGKRLHSVKWYRDVHEIFRYNPEQKPSIRLFNATDVVAQRGECHEERCLVEVMPAPTASRAAYTCEVSGEGPEFQIARQAKYMTVVAMPENDPIITGAPNLVRRGELVLLNCTSDYSLPPADINWYIDDQLQKPETWQRTELSDAQVGGLRASWRVVRVRIPPSASGAIRVRCEALLPLQPPVVRDTTVTLTLYSQAQLSKYVASTGNSICSGSFIAIIWTLKLILIPTSL